jgi:hypothetical protein
MGSVIDSDPMTFKTTYILILLMMIRKPHLVVSIRQASKKSF